MILTARLRASGCKLVRSLGMWREGLGGVGACGCSMCKLAASTITPYSEEVEWPN